MDYKADLHTCGQPLSESLHQQGRAGLDRYRAGFSVCDACLALDHAMRRQAKTDEQIEKSGGVVTPQARLWQLQPKT